MNRDPDERAQPDGEQVPDEFDAIVAGWQREGAVPEWPDDQDTDGPAPDAPAPSDARPVTFRGFAAAASGKAPPGDASPPDPAPAEEEDHFVPPEPPPLPRLGPPGIVGLVLLGLGFVLILSPNWVGVPAPYGLPLGLVTLASGLGWLVLRLWPDTPEGDGDGEDDGAVL